jgi:hypothetical protein
VRERERFVKILHILKKEPDTSTKKIIKTQAAGNDVKTIELYGGETSYEKLVADVFSSDKVFCW